jgi:hypothetical protein
VLIELVLIKLVLIELVLIKQGRDDAAQVTAGGLLGFGGLARGDRESTGDFAYSSRVRRRFLRHSHVAILKISNKIVNNLLSGRRG